MKIVSYICVTILMTTNMKRFLSLLILCIVTLGACNRHTPTPPQPEDNYTYLSFLSGIYYGETDGAYNYFIVLSNRKECLDVATGDFFHYEKYEYLFLDLYASEPSEEYNKKFFVPQGTYTLDTTNSKASGTLSSQYSYLYRNKEKISLTSCDVEVNINGISAIITDSSGNTHQYQCHNRKVDNYNIFGNNYSDETLSNLSDDVFINNCYAQATELGDYYVVGKKLWWLYILRDESNEMIIFELLTPLDAETPAGNYIVWSNLYQDYLALPGYISGDGDTWSWYYRTDDSNNAISYAPIVSGELSVKQDSNGELAATFNLKDDAENFIYGQTENYTK